MLEDITGEEIKRQFKTNSTLRFVSIFVGALVLIVLGYFLYRQYIWGPANEKSMDSYWEGLNYAKMDSTATALDQLQGVVKKHDGKIGGEVAQFVYARQLMVEGNFKKALKELESVNVSDTYISVCSVGLQGDCYSELGDYEKAANIYLKAAEMNDNDYTTPMYLFKAGLCAEEIKNFEKAAECYQRISDDYPGYASQKQIEKYLSRASNKTTSA